MNRKTSDYSKFGFKQMDTRFSRQNSGQEALEVVQAEAPDLILLDIMMPGMNGFEVCQQIRADEFHANLFPVVMVTALASRKIESSNEAGADDFISKPFDKP